VSLLNSRCGKERGPNGAGSGRSPGLALGGSPLALKRLPRREGQPTRRGLFAASWCTRTRRRLGVLLVALITSLHVFAACAAEPGGQCPPRTLAPLQSGHCQAYGPCAEGTDFPLCGLLLTVDIDMDQRLAVVTYESGGHVYEETWRIFRQDEDAAAFDDASAADLAAPSEPDTATDVGPDPGAG